MSDHPGPTAEERARRRVEERNGLLVHTVVYVLVNAFLWIQDLVGGGGLDWAYWATIPWGVGLAIHAAGYAMSNGRMNDRAYEKFLAEERAKERERQHS